MKKEDSGQRQRMFDIIERWHQSDSSQRSFCLEHNIPHWQFKYWYSKYRNGSNTRGRAKVSSKDKFIPVKLADPLLEAGCEIKVLFPNGVRIECSSLEGVDRLATLIKQF